jgi:cleavage and polyadenylation specificity factor subunit 3
MARLKSALLSKYSSQRDRVKVFNPRNCDELRLYFKGEKVAKVVGSLANNPPTSDVILNGVLVQKDFDMSLIAAEDLREFAGLDTNVVMQRQTISFHGGLGLLKWHLDQMFGGVISETGDGGRKPMFKIMDSVVVIFEEAYLLSINWIGNAMNDTIADAVLAIVLAAESSPASLKGISREIF